LDELGRMNWVDDDDQDEPVFHRPNQCLLNEYSDGQGIQMHKDGPLYESYAVVISLQGDAVMEFASRSGDAGARAYRTESSLLLQRRSLLLFAKLAYETLYHGIRKAKADTIEHHILNADAAGVRVGDVINRLSSSEPRLSLTIRHVRRCIPEDSVLVTDAMREELKRREKTWLRGIDEGRT